MQNIPKINKDDRKFCWWCNSADLSSEHKFKKTDLKKLYGKGEAFKQMGVTLVDYRNNAKSKKFQSASSDFAKFEKSLCINCNNIKSQKSDFAYEKLIDYYLSNEEDLKSKKTIDFYSVYGANWLEEKENLYRYVMKHVGCRLFENHLMPFNDTIKYLNGFPIHPHLIVILQIKPYKLFEIDTLYKGSFIPIVSNKLLNDVFAVCGWFTIKNLTFNYVHEWNINLDECVQSNLFRLYITNYSNFNSSFEVNENTIATDCGYIIEKLEYYPYKPQEDELNIYQDLRLKNIY